MSAPEVHELEAELSASRAGEDISRLFGAFLILMLASMAMSEMDLDSPKGQPVQTDEQETPTRDATLVHLELEGDQLFLNGDNLRRERLGMVLQEAREKAKGSGLEVVITLADTPWHRLLDDLQREGVEDSEVFLRRYRP
jgi:hypothetical protein